MKPILLIVLLLTILSFAQLSAYADDCDNVRKIEKVIDATAISKLKVIARAGLLEIIAYAEDDDSNEIQVDAEICSDNKKGLEQMDVSFSASGEAGEIETIIGKKNGWFSDGNHKINLILKVPQRLMLDVDDSSGSALIKGVASLNMNDSSGSLNIEGIAGDLNLKDSSGSIEIEDVGGSVVLSDSSGSILVRNVGADVLVKQDSSGSIKVNNVGGDFVVNVDSSGSISAANIGGHFWVREDGSGSIDYKNVAGKVDIPKN